MSYQIEDALAYLQGKVGSISGIKEAPPAPPEAMAQFPFALAYVSSFSSIGGSSGFEEVLDTLVVEIHVARQVLPKDFVKALGYRNEVIKLLVDDPSLGGTIDTYTDVRGTFGWLQYAGESHLGWRIEIEVKGKIGC
jgi:hypothetical protein